MRATLRVQYLDAPNMRSLLRTRLLTLPVAYRRMIVDCCWELLLRSQAYQPSRAAHKKNCARAKRNWLRSFIASETARAPLLPPAFVGYNPALAPRQGALPNRIIDLIREAGQLQSSAICAFHQRFYQ